MSTVAIPTTTPAGGGGLFDAYALLRDEKAAGTNGGTFTAGAWRTRTLNTEVDPDGIVTLADPQFTLPAGAYYIKARAPGWFVQRHKTRLFNITDTADAIIGSSAYSNPTDGDQTDSVVNGRITIAGAKVFELQHWSTATEATDGFGTASNIDSKIEVYSEVEIWREAA